MQGNILGTEKNTEWRKSKGDDESAKKSAATQDLAPRKSGY